MSLVFVTQLVGAVLFLVHWKQVSSLRPAVAPSRSPPSIMPLIMALGPSATSWRLGRCRDALLTLTFTTSTLSKPEPSCVPL